MNRRDFLKGLPFLFTPLPKLVQTQEFDLQTEINAAPNGGTVNVPHGVHEIGSVIIPVGKYIHIQGVSPAMLGQSPGRNSPQWDWLLENYPQDFILGSILRGTISATLENSRVAMTDIVMIGHGDGVAVDITCVQGTRFTSVSFGNYEIGLRATGVYNLTVDRCAVSGCDIGLQIKDGNLNRVRDCDMFYCRIGADIRGEVNFMGGSFQACEDGLRIWQTAGLVGGIHFEQNSGTALFFDGYGGHLQPCFYATNAGRIVINGYNNFIDLGWGVDTEFTAQSQSNIVRLFGDYTNLGWNNKFTTGDP